MADNDSHSDGEGEVEFVKSAKRDTGQKELCYWHWQTNALVLPENTTDIEEVQEGLELTAFLMDKLRKVTINNVRFMIENHPKVQRLVTLKVIRDKGDIVPNTIQLGRPQQASAVAAHIVLPQVNKRSCKACASVKSKGPFAECKSFGDEYFGGSCSCCQYSSLATSCTFNRKQKGTEYAEASDAKAYDAKAESSKLNLTPESARKMPIHTLERFKTIIEAELQERADEYEIDTPTKKRKR